MSWLGGYNPAKSKEAAAREEKRKKLEAERIDRLQRAHQRAQRQKQLQKAQEAQQEADKALEEFLAIDPSILTAEGPEISEDEIQQLLAAEAIADQPSLEEAGNMADFETENGTDGEKALDKLGSVKCEFSKDDIEFWFTELETQLEIIEVKSQWTKRIALQRFLPAEIKQEVKSLLVIQKANAGTTIYKRIKTELLDLFGAKPEDAYMRAKNRVMTGKPSQLGNALIADLCTCATKLQSGCCAKIIWGMYREALPTVIRNHIAEMEFNKTTYKQIFKKSDQIFDSNRSNQPVRGAAAVASTTTTTTGPASPEVAAISPQR